MNNLLKQVIDENRKYTNYGQVASYIPELKNAKRSDLGICIIDKDNKIYTAGNYNTKFTIQIRNKWYKKTFKSYDKCRCNSNYFTYKR